MIEEANGWYIASRRCHADMAFSPNVTQSLLNQTIVCNAFAVEMYVKSLLVISKITYAYDHGFDELFMCLPQDVQKRAHNRFTDYWKYQDNDLAAYLTETADWFTRFRYHFEKMAKFMTTGIPTPGYSLNLQKFWTVTRALHNTLVELAPDLTIPGETSCSFERGKLPY
jgi:hypothetical protein